MLAGFVILVGIVSVIIGIVILTNRFNDDKNWPSGKD